MQILNLGLLLLLLHELLLDLKVDLGALLLVLMQLLLQMLRLGPEGVRTAGLLVVVQRKHVLLIVLELLFGSQIVLIVGVSNGSQSVQIVKPFGHVAYHDVGSLAIIVFGFSVFDALLNVVDHAFPGRSELHEPLRVVSSWNRASANINVHHTEWHTSYDRKFELVILCLNLVHILGLFHFLDGVVVIQRNDGGVKLLGHPLVRLLHLWRVGSELLLLQGQLGWLRLLLDDHALLFHTLALHVLEILLDVNRLENLINIWLGPGSSGLNETRVDIAKQLVVDVLQLHLVDGVHLAQLLLIHLERQIQVLGVLDLVLKHDVLLFEVGWNLLLFGDLLTILSLWEHVADRRLAVVFSLLLLDRLLLI